VPQIHVCPLSKIPATVSATGARSLITLINKGTPVDRPIEITAARHLNVPVSDIVVELEGHILPAETHVAAIVDFVRDWDRAEPLLIHCYAGVSRSTAAAFIAACVLAPERPEIEIAQAIRAASPTASPNTLLVEVADRMLARNGRMVAAVKAIGRGEECMEGVPFALELS
jgi:predicted protein tyrosine phosphatase